MNRHRAKLLTLLGFICCAVSATLLIRHLIGKMDISPLIAALFFVAGIILIVFSLAYYTEK